jgi:hypothetical protein
MGFAPILEVGTVRGVVGANKNEQERAVGKGDVMAM